MFDGAQTRQEMASIFRLPVGDDVVERDVPGSSAIVPPEAVVHQNARRRSPVGPMLVATTLLMAIGAWWAVEREADVPARAIVEPVTEERPTPSASPPGSATMEAPPVESGPTRPVTPRRARDRQDVTNPKPPAASVPTNPSVTPHLTGAALERALAEDAAITRRLNAASLRRLEAGQVEVEKRSN